MRNQIIFTIFEMQQSGHDKLCGNISYITYLSYSKDFYCEAFMEGDCRQRKMEISISN